MQGKVTARVGDMRIENDEGEVVIAATQRADGTWRPAIRVKKGYVPQEEIGAWKSRAQLGKKSEIQPTNYSIQHESSNIIMGSKVVSEKSEKNRRRNERRREILHQKQLEELRGEEVEEPTISIQDVAESDTSDISTMSLDDLQKLEKRLRKKLRQIILLEERIRNGSVLEFSINSFLMCRQEQQQKITMKDDILKELVDLEKESEKRC